MRKILAIVALLVVCGCNQPPPPLPSIEVENHNTTDWNGITVRYQHHDTAGNVTLETPEEIAACKKQVEFLLKELEEAERKMNVHTDEPVQSNEPVD